MKTLFVVCMILALAVPAMAQTPAPAISWPGINLGGDTAYLFTHNSFAVGSSIDIVNIKDSIFTVRGTVLFPAGAEHNESTAITGLSGVVNLKKAIENAGWQWVANTLNPSIGLFGGYDFGNTKWAGGAIMQILRLEF